MISDPVATAGLVQREVRTSSRNGQTTRMVVARRTYATDQADLWDALTNDERLPRWFAPVSGELKLGGRYQVEGNAGGVIETCEEPETFAVTWEFGGQVSWLRINLIPSAGETTLELVHEAVVDPDFWAQFGPGAVGVGWDLGLMGLGIHLETKESIRGDYSKDWSTTPDGVQFVRRAAEGWAEAAIADGDDATAAREAAERTISFHTVVPDEAPEG